VTTPSPCRISTGSYLVITSKTIETESLHLA
jgi:hypothetical protein